MKTADFINKRPKLVVEAQVEAPVVVELTMPEFTFEHAEAEYNKELNEDASAGATCSSVVAVSMETLGGKGGFSRQDVIKRLGSYGNKPRGAGPVKVGK
jgi:hypothetical protein